MTSSISVQSNPEEPKVGEKSPAFVLTPEKYKKVRPLLNRRDIDGDIPGVFIDIENRGTGKTTSFLQYMIEQWVEFDHQFGLLYRNVGECEACAELLNGVLKYYPNLGHEATSKARASGIYQDMYIDGKKCGCAIPLKNPDKLRKYSSQFELIEYLYMDEVTAEDVKYLDDEIGKLQSVIVTVARGQGKQSRPIKTILAGNPVNIMNPYYIYFGIYNRLRPGTKKLKGKGWVGEFIINEHASKALADNPALKAFQGTNYMAYARDGELLFDETMFVEKVSGKFKYLFTIKINGNYYGCRRYYNQDILYFTRKYLENYPVSITLKHSQQDRRTRVLSKSSWIYKQLKESHDNNNMRFEDGRVKTDVYEFLAIDIYS